MTTVLCVNTDNQTFDFVDQERNINKNIDNDELGESVLFHKTTAQEEKHEPAIPMRNDVKTLEAVKQKQKQLEQENACRKALLAKAVIERKCKTIAEVQKLSEIQNELAHLDLMLNSEVAALRNRIEAASFEFNEAQKRYDKAEKEFVEAKQKLFKKMERKEQLTEYLCTIIEQSEVRKARKLTELMKQLEVDDLLYECEANGMSYILPKLCALSNVTDASAFSE
ncbi:RAB6-interacting golgin-like [Limulus polyphemus]|uniref:RAB6-interacting golgin n=1 Tax=Limulus polyphemus TaxID=6850 RepID=A0ABM1B1D4_LIMPO|nr:RAB6-interacting golgin-like [Limulus polyphemus]XP_022239672.1 RAB6-interacting golgin-like [Limulus polyphemus]XP_022239673.1 RAB6-interacting golgin-like [Limulus polyphemus]XP_022239674.1 RAB6-interacting golgin-like [Limulus polyphemus]